MDENSSNHTTATYSDDSSTSQQQHHHRPLHKRGRSLTLFGSRGRNYDNNNNNKIHSSPQPSPPPSNNGCYNGHNNHSQFAGDSLPSPQPFPSLSLSPTRRNRSKSRLQSQSKSLQSQNHQNQSIIKPPPHPSTSNATTKLESSSIDNSHNNNDNFLKNRPSAIVRSSSSSSSGIPTPTAASIFRRSLRCIFLVIILIILMSIALLHQQLFLNRNATNMSTLEYLYRSSSPISSTTTTTTSNGEDYSMSSTFGALTSTIRSSLSSMGTNEWDIRSKERRKRTRPPMQSSSSLEPVVYQSLSLSNDNDESTETTILSNASTKSNTTKTSPSSSSSICGRLANQPQLSVKFSPNSQDVLNESSRVVITGILNQVGFHLALKLHKECNVQHIFGIDTFAPQTMQHRTDAIKRYRLLKKYIPALQPIMIPLVGIHPQQNNNKKKKVSSSQMELFTAIQPTHIVHLSEYSEEYQYTTDKELNQQNEKSMTSHLLSPIPTSLYTIRNAAISMEQLLNGLYKLSLVANVANGEDDEDAKATTTTTTTTTDDKKSSSSLLSFSFKDKSFPPHFMFATTTTSASATSSISNFPKMYYDISRYIELSLQSSYRSLLDTFAMGLVLPCTYGPYGHRDSLSIQLGQSTILQQQTSDDGASKNISTPLQVLDEEIFKLADNDKSLSSQPSPPPLCDQYLNVDEVVDAIILGMQYRNPNGKFEMFDTIKTIKQVVKDQQAEESSSKKGKSKHSKEWSLSKSTPYVGPITPKELAKAMMKYYGLEDSQEEKSPASEKSTTSILQTQVRKQLAWQYTEMVPLETNTSPPRPFDLFNEIDQSMDHGLSHSDNKDDMDTESKLTANSYHLPDALPCASECSYEGRCVPTFWDDAVKVSRDWTRSKEKCQIVLYMVNLWADVTHLNQTSAPSKDPEMEELVCKVAFVSFNSDLVQNALSREAASSGNIPKKSSTSKVYSPDSKRVAAYNGQLVVNGWTLIWVHGSDATQFTEAEYALAKISPGSLFSSRIPQAMYVHPDSFVVPSTDRVLLMLNMVHEPARKAQRAKNGRAPVPARKGRHPILLGPELNIADVGLKPTSRAKIFAKYLCDLAGIPMSKGLSTRTEVYEKIQDLVRRLRNQFGEARTPHGEFPFRWMRTLWVFHDFRTPMAKELRCDWYKEQTFWPVGNSEMDDLSLAYVLATRGMEGRLGNPLEDDISWLPMLDPDATEYEKETGENAVLHKGVEMYVRIFTRQNKDK